MKQPQQFRKKPVVISAFQFTGDNGVDIIEWAEDVSDNAMRMGETDQTLLISTLEGTMEVSKGDYVILGVKSELYPCKPDIFEATYEVVK